MRRYAPFLLALLASPASAAVLATGTGPSVPWFRLITALLVCIAVALGAILLLKRHQRGELKLPALAWFKPGGRLIPRPTPNRLAVLETRRASQHGDLCLAELDGELFFLALTPAGATIIARKPTHKATASSEITS